MSPPWPTIEKIVTELGSVCSERYGIQAIAVAESMPDDDAQRHRRDLFGSSR